MTVLESSGYDLLRSKATRASAAFAVVGRARRWWGSTREVIRVELGLFAPFYTPRASEYLGQVLCLEALPKMLVVLALASWRYQEDSMVLASSLYLIMDLPVWAFT